MHSNDNVPKRLSNSRLLDSNGFGGMPGVGGSYSQGGSAGKVQVALIGNWHSGISPPMMQLASDNDSNDTDRDDRDDRDDDRDGRDDDRDDGCDDEDTLVGQHSPTKSVSP